MATTKLNESYDIYEVHFDGASFDELHNLYAEKVLLNARTSEVESALTGYVTSIIEPTGWNAIWKAPKQSSSKGKHQFSLDCEFLVEVHDVSMKKLQATVQVLELLKHGPVEEGSESFDRGWLEGLMEIDVPLIQLYPLLDTEGVFLGTAKAIHTVRFFYENLWRPWDDEDDEGSFVEKHLRGRLEFYFELISGCLPELVECHCHDLLTEAGEVRTRMERLQSQMALSDSEEELQEEDVRSCVYLHMRMESLQREMEILENPLLRNLMSKKDLHEPPVQRNEAVIHVVSDRVTFGMIKSLPLKENTVLQIHSTVEVALSAAISGDTVLIFPGHYKMGPIPWLEQNLTIKGLGQVVLEAGEGSGDLFLSCSAQSLTLSNLQLIPSPQMHATVMALQGSLILEHCVITGAKNTIVVLESASVQLEDCQIRGSLGDAIQLRSGSRCTLAMCSIQECQGSALKVDGNAQSKTGNTHLAIINCNLNRNGHYAVLAECSADLIHPQETVTWEKLKSLPNLDLTIDSVDVAENLKGELGLCPLELSKVSPIAAVSSSEEISGSLHTSFPKPEFLALSDSDEY